MSELLPTVSHIYQNYALDSTLWQRYRPRADDIVVTTSYKSGTTWVRTILAHLILGTHAIPDIGTLSPWIEHRVPGFDDTLERLEAQQHRRFHQESPGTRWAPFLSSGQVYRGRTRCARCLHVVLESSHALR